MSKFNCLCLRIIALMVSITFWVSFLASLWISSGFNSISAQETKMLITQIACVDIAKILNTVNQNPAMKRFLLSLEEGYQQESLAIKKKIRELEDYLLENQDDLNKNRSEEIFKEIEYQRLTLEETLLIESENHTSEENILKGIYRLIKEIAEQDGLSIIIEKSSAVVYNKPEVDITDKVIEMMSANETEEEEE